MVNPEDQTAQARSLCWMKNPWRAGRAPGGKSRVQNSGPLGIAKLVQITILAVLGYVDMLVCWYVDMLICRYVDMLIYVDICWYMLIYVDICWYMLIYVDICWYMLIYVDICWYMLIYVDICWYMLIYVDICWYMLIYVDICWYMLIYVDMLVVFCFSGFGRWVWFAGWWFGTWTLFSPI